jgi:hypothetical protein
MLAVLVYQLLCLTCTSVHPRRRLDVRMNSASHGRLQLSERGGASSPGAKGGLRAGYVDDSL